MAHLAVEINENTIEIRSQAFCGEFQNTDENQKALFVFLRLLSCPETGKSLFTNQQVADAFGKKDRRDIDNFVRDFRKRGGDFLRYLARKNAKQERGFPAIERQIVESPLLSIAEHYRLFCEAHPHDRICEQTFRSYVNEIAVTKILKRVRQFGFKKDQSFDVRRYLEEVLALERLSRAKQKEIVETFPEVDVSSSAVIGSRFAGLSCASLQKKLVVVMLYACTVPQEVLALLFGVGKTSIHHWIYDMCADELNWQILGEIVWWSGRVSVDEKWVKIKGVWYFVLSAVDAETGFPLLVDLYPACDAVSWALFFRRFKAIYGLPKLIQCDGSKALAAARAIVFTGVRYQLCKFHKLKNLMKRLRQSIDEPKLLTRCVRLAKHMFTNASVSSRKAAAKRLQKLAGAEVSAYLEDHILSPWRQLTLSLTTNASERFNRKIEKCFSGRYGIPSEESAKVLLRGLWLKEMLLHGQQQMEAHAELQGLDLSKICQEHLDTGKILQFFHDYDLSHAEKLG